MADSRPSPDEQLDIAEILKRADDKRVIHELTRDSLMSLFRTLLHELMSAEIRIDQLDLSPLEISDIPVRGA